MHLLHRPAYGPECKYFLVLIRSNRTHHVQNCRLSKKFLFGAVMSYIENLIIFDAWFQTVLHCFSFFYFSVSVFVLFLFFFVFVLSFFVFVFVFQRILLKTEL